MTVREVIQFRINTAEKEFKSLVFTWISFPVHVHCTSTQTVPKDRRGMLHGRHGEGSWRWRGGKNRLFRQLCWLLSAESICKIMAWISDLWHSQASPAEIFGQHHITSLYFCTAQAAFPTKPVCSRRQQDKDVIHTWPRQKAQEPCRNGGF